MKKLFFVMTIAVLSSAYALAQTGTGSTSKEATTKATLNYVAQGSKAYLNRDYKKAIEAYSKALELEKKEPTLEKNIWRVVIDNLGMSYGISGNLKKAKEVFEYGLSKDSEYPMFYYNLACTYAEMKDLDNTISSLKLAYRYKSNMISGETFPDPTGDSSFQPFMKNEKFLKALEEMAR